MQTETAARKPTGNGPAFNLGRTVATPEALRQLGKLGVPPIRLIARHASGDWGDLCAQDRQANEEAIRDDERILSAYQLEGQKFYVITEADRSVTTVLLAYEY